MTISCCTESVCSVCLASYHPVFYLSQAFDATNVNICLMAIKRFELKGEVILTLIQTI